MFYKIVNALGGEASERQVESINHSCDHINVWRVKGTRLFDCETAAGVAALRKTALEYGLFIEAGV